MEEYFDVLNERGHYLNIKETREKCHKEGLWHKAVAIFVLNSNDEVLLQKRSPNKKMWPNMWDMTAGGHVFSGELGFQAVIRELKEELGINLDKTDITFIGSALSTNIKGELTDNHFNEYYIAQKDIEINELILQEDEVTEAKWMSKDEILQRINDGFDGITDKQGCWDALLKYYEYMK